MIASGPRRHVDINTAQPLEPSENDIGADGEWEKVLWRRQPFPDNYVPNTFLSELRDLRMSTQTCYGQHSADAPSSTISSAPCLAVLRSFTHFATSSRHSSILCGLLPTSDRPSRCRGSRLGLRHTWTRRVRGPQVGLEPSPDARSHPGQFSLLVHLNKADEHSRLATPFHPTPTTHPPSTPPLAPLANSRNTHISYDVRLDLATCRRSVLHPSLACRLYDWGRCPA